MKTIKMLFVLGVFLIGANASSWATYLDLFPLFQPLNEFEGNDLNVNYDYATSNLLVVGGNQYYGLDNNLLVDYASPNSVFTLDATVNHTGVLTAGTLTITGNLGNGWETLLTGNLVTGPSGIAFGFVDPPITDLPGGGNTFEFMFSVTGGEPTIINNDWFGQQYGGIFLDAYFDNFAYDIPFNGTWTSDFNNNGGTTYGAGNSSVFVIPEPCSILLVSTGGVLFAAACRRRLKAVARHILS